MNSNSSSVPLRLVACLVVAASAPSALQAQSFNDDFNSGTDAGWTHYSPLAGFGAPATFSFPAGGYRIQVGGSPNPGALGPGRGASFRADQTYGDFNLSYDIVGHGPTPQFIGAFTRVSSVGLGTLNGYAMGFDYSANRMYISRITGEAVVGVVASSDLVTLAADKSYRLSFAAEGSNLSGSLVDVATGTTLATASGSDATYLSGVIGLGVAVQSATAGVAGDGSFDNFKVQAIPEPPEWALLATGAMALAVWRRRS